MPSRFGSLGSRAAAAIRGGLDGAAAGRRDRRSTPRRPAGWRPAAAAGGCGGWCGSREAPELVRARLRQQRLDRRELQQLGAATEQRHIGIDAAQVGALALSPFGLLAPAAGRIAQCLELGLLAAEALAAD